MRTSFRARRLSLLLLVAAIAVTWSNVGLAEPPPYPEFTVYNQTPYTIKGCWGVSYVRAGQSYQTFNGIPGDTCYSDRDPSTTIGPNSSQTRSTSDRFSTDGVSTIYISYTSLPGMSGGPWNTYFSGKDGPTEKQIAGNLWARISIGLPSGFLSLGGTGWTGRDYVRIYFFWR